MKTIKKEKIALFLIILIQVIVYLIMGMQKAYIHMDEAYSIGLTNYDKVEITQNEDFYNHWHTKDYYEDYISISQEEAGNFKPVYENQKNDVHPPFFYLLLRIAYSVSLNHFSKWPGILLNIVILIISNIFVYKIVKELTKNEKIALLICFANGLVVATFESVMYIRMYALSSMLLLILTYLHLHYFKQKEISLKAFFYIGITSLIASLTHYYNVIYIAILAILYIFYQIRYKQYKNIIKYSITMIIAAILSIAIFPYSIQHIFMGYRGQGTLSAFQNPEQMLSNLLVFGWIANSNIFNNTLFGILLFFLFYLGYQLIKEKQVVIKVPNMAWLFIVLPTLVYYFFVTVSAPYTEIRYLIPICSFIFIGVIYLLYVVLCKLFHLEQAKKIFVVFLLFLLLMPIISHIKINNLYLERKDIVSKIEKEYTQMPTIYLFNTSQNRFLDDIYLFTKIEESYILDVQTVNENKIEEILKEKNTEHGILLWVNEGFEKEKYITMIMKEQNFTHCEHMQRMNACDIYYLSK